MLFIKNHISGDRTVEARMRLKAEGTVEESESRTELHVLGVAAWMQGVERELCLTPCQADKPP